MAIKVFQVCRRLRPSVQRQRTEQHKIQSLSLYCPFLLSQSQESRKITVPRGLLRRSLVLSPVPTLPPLNLAYSTLAPSTNHKKIIKKLENKSRMKLEEEMKLECRAIDENTRIFVVVFVVYLVLVWAGNKYFRLH